jgi:hypothetical protein
VIIDDFHLMGISIYPHKADPPLIIDTNAVLPCSIASQLLKAISGQFLA